MQIKENTLDEVLEKLFTKSRKYTVGEWSTGLLDKHVIWYEVKEIYIQKKFLWLTWWGWKQISKKFIGTEDRKGYYPVKR